MPHRWSLPDVWAYAAFITANNYLQAQNIVQPQVITSAIVLALHLPLNLLCIYTLGGSNFSSRNCVLDLSMALCYSAFILYLLLSSVADHGIRWPDMTLAAKCTRSSLSNGKSNPRHVSQFPLLA